MISYSVTTLLSLVATDGHRSTFDNTCCFTDMQCCDRINAQNRQWDDLHGSRSISYASGYGETNYAFMDPRALSCSKLN